LRHPIQDKATVDGHRLVKLGSKNCGWTILDDPSLRNGGTVLSAGLGEDASFDVELVTKYDVVVHIVDPTPRAIVHFSAIEDRLGLPRNRAYSESGTQPVEAYDLRKATSENIKFHNVALWNENKRIKFFLPKNEVNVSHSIINYQNNYSENTPFIEVDAVTLENLCDSGGIPVSSIVLLKLDIEGAEIEVLESILSIGVRPRQILVEFDELNVPNKRGIERVDRAYKCLLRSGYNLIHTDHQADFLFVRDS
jgi:FkbM family methyltransferase